MGRGEQRIVLLTKIEPPQSSLTTLRRSKLLSLLNKNRTKKVILICAGAGYGKTTLISQFLAQKHIRYMYYHLEREDSEPAIFISYILSGLKKLDAKFGKKTASLSRFFNNFSRYRDIIVGTLLNEIVERFSGDVYIVLEDYHALAAPGRIDAVVDYMLQHLPPKLHFIVTSRTIPGFQLSRLRAHGDILELTTEQLRFSLKEIEQFFKKVHTKPLKMKEVKWIEHHSEGWPTSFRLMLQSPEYLEGIKSSSHVREILDNYYRSQASLFNYFAQEIFLGEPEHIQRFLVDCSLFEWMTPGLCDAVTKRSACGSILSRLTRRNAFLFKIPNQGFRFHNLYQEFLHSKLTDPNRERSLHQRAAEYFQSQQRFLDALKYYVRGEHYKRACGLVARHGFEIIRQGQSGVLNSYIEAIPVQIRNSHPGVLLMYAQTLVHMGRSEEAKTVLVRATRLFRERRGRQVDGADALYELGGIYLNQDMYREARRYFLRALQICPVRAHLTRAAILNSLGFVHNTLGGRYMARVVGYFQKAYNIAYRKKLDELRASVLNNWALHEWKKGDIYPAYQKLVDMVRLLKVHYSPHCGAGYFNAARLCLLLGKTAEAEKILDSGSLQCSQYNDQWSMAALWKGFGLLYDSVGDHEKAKHYVMRSLRVYEDLGVVRLAITSLNELCQIHINGGELNAAEKDISAIWWFKKNKDDGEAVGLCITEARLRIAQTKFQHAASVLISALGRARRFKQPLNVFYARVELSRVFHAMGKEDVSLDHFQKAILLSRSRGYEYLLRRVLKQNQWIVAMLTASGVEHEYVSRAIVESNQYKHHLEGIVFGKPSFTINGIKIVASMWKTKNAEKIFCYLMLNKGEPVDSDRLVDIFWPKSGLRAGRFNLRKSVQYIRQTLSQIDRSMHASIRSAKGVYSISPDVMVSTDVDVFEKLTSRFRIERRKSATGHPDMDQLLRLYKDDFAVGWYDDWVEEKRHYYKNLFMDILAMQADLCTRKKKFKDAVRYYRMLIDHNILEEEYHRKYMMACAKCRQHKEIIQDYKKLTTALKRILGKKPESSTTRLYTSLVDK